MQGVPVCRSVDEGVRNLISFLKAIKFSEGFCKELEQVLSLGRPSPSVREEGAEEPSFPPHQHDQLEMLRTMTDSLQWNISNLQNMLKQEEVEDVQHSSRPLLDHSPNDKEVHLSSTPAGLEAADQVDQGIEKRNETAMSDEIEDSKKREEEEEEEEMNDDTTVLTCLSFEELFEPGSVFIGTIQIPVDGPDPSGFGQQVPYYLQVIRSFRDVRGQFRLLIKHGAHDDEQACVLSLDESTENVGEVRIKYADFETICTGVANLASKSMEGRVEQLVYGEDGYKVKADEKTHRFFLKRVETPREKVELRTLLLERQCEYALLVGLRFWLRQNVFSLDVNQVLMDECALILSFASQFSAMLLHYAQEFRELNFNSYDDKRAAMKRINENGLSRKTIQCCWDTLTGLSLPILSQVISVLVASRAVHMIHPLKSKSKKEQVRVHLCYSRYDKALREAESRVPLEVVVGMAIQDPAEVESIRLNTCCICMSDFTDQCQEGQGEFASSSSSQSPLPAILRTPCKHLFHFSCAKEWFRDQHNCPLCRTECVQTQDS